MITHAATGASPKASTTWASPKAAWYTVAVLLLSYTLAYIDRAILTILVEPIQRDLQINDTQISLLHGFAFVIFYVTLGLPMGYIADRVSRKNLIVISIAAWSAMTAACGLSRTYGQLFLARVGVGVGEAGLSPASYSMIADYFPPERRSAALGVYTAALYLGGGCALLLGGLVVGLIGEQPTMSVPLLGEIRSWQVVFLILGAVGILVSLLALSLREPARRNDGLARNAAAGTGLAAQIGEVWQYIKLYRRVYALHFFAFGILGVPFNVALLWARPYLTRQFDVSRTDAAYLVGGIMLVCASSGVIAGSLLADYLQRKGKVDATIRVGLIASAALLVPMALFGFMPTASLAAVCLAALLFFGAFAYGAAPAALQLVTPNHMRGVVSAAYLMVLNLLSLAIGPTATGFLTDYVFHDPKAVGMSASIVGTVAAVVAVVLFICLLKPYRNAVAAVKAG